MVMVRYTKKNNSISIPCQHTNQSFQMRLEIGRRGTIMLIMAVFLPAQICLLGFQLILERNNHRRHFSPCKFSKISFLKVTLKAQRKWGTASKKSGRLPDRGFESDRYDKSKA